MLRPGDSQRVAELMRDTAAAELLPRFRNLAADDIRQKRPGDVVTVADIASEQRLAVGLAKILPGVPVVGEEAVEADPGLLDLIGRRGESCWIVDPLDGTSNFSKGRDWFAMIVCLVHDTETVAGWILDVPNDRMAIAARGEGSALDGQSIRLASTEAAPRGYIGFSMRKAFDRQLAPEQRRRLGNLDTRNCAGREYIDLLAEQREFNLYRRTKPWDHAAGALLIREAGGVAERFDGSPYGPAGSQEGGIITAVSPEVMSAVRSVFDAVQLPLLAAKPT